MGLEGVKPSNTRIKTRAPPLQTRIVFFMKLRQTNKSLKTFLRPYQKNSCKTINIKERKVNPQEKELNLLFKTANFKNNKGRLAAAYKNQNRELDFLTKKTNRKHLGSSQI